MTQRAIIIVPPWPSFSPASIARLLQVSRSTVAYWIHANKVLVEYRDNLNEPYVTREELCRFLHDYLHRHVVG